MIFCMPPPVFTVGDMLVNVVTEVAALAECCEVCPVVVLAVAVEVGNGENDAGKAVEL